MSMFGGMDRGVEGDAPFIGRQVLYQSSDSTFDAAVVLDVREDGWTVSLRDFVTNDMVEFVPYGGNDGFGTIPVGTWVTPDQYEGWRIYASERAAMRGDDGVSGGESR